MCKALVNYVDESDLLLGSVDTWGIMRDTELVVTISELACSKDGALFVDVCFTIDMDYSESFAIEATSGQGSIGNDGTI